MKGAEDYLVFGGGQSEPHPDMHPKEAHAHPINLLKGKECFGSVRERLRHLPESTNLEQRTFCLHASPFTQTRLAVLTHVVQANRVGRSFGPLAQVFRAAPPFSVTASLDRNFTFLKTVGR